MEETKIANAISVNPLGLLFGVINGEYERIIGPDVSVVGNLSYSAVSFGVWRWSALSVGGGAKK